MTNPRHELETQPHPSTDSEESKVRAYSVEIDRRSVLMALGATGAAMMLPSSWSTPAMQWGVLPAHAQTSGGGTGGGSSGGGSSGGGSSGGSSGGGSGASSGGGNTAGEPDSGLVDGGPAEAGPPSACPPADPKPTPIVTEAYAPPGGMMPDQPYWEVRFGPGADDPCSVTAVASASYEPQLNVFLTGNDQQGRAWSANPGFEGVRFTVTNVSPPGKGGSSYLSGMPFDTVITVDGFFSFDGGTESARIQLSVTDKTASAKAKVSLLKVEIPGPT